MAKNTRQQEKDRRAKIEAMREAERAKERRKSLLFIVLAVVLGVGLIAAAAVPAYLDSRNDPANKDLASFGVSAAAADCDDVVTKDAEGQGNHSEEGTRLEYEDVPPMFGPHVNSWEFPARGFYTEKDRPALEKLVHNLEHGYTILWYDPSVSDAKKDVLRDIAASARQTEMAGPGEKFIVTAWDDSYGEMPEDQPFALTHWSAEEGHRQMCGDISGDVVKDFMEKYPSTDAPEPNAS